MDFTLIFALAVAVSFCVPNVLVCSEQEKLRINNIDAFKEAKEIIFKTPSAKGWLLLTYYAENAVYYHNRGYKKTEDLFIFIEDRAIQYALVRVVREDGTWRDVFIHYIGKGETYEAKKTKFLDEAKLLLMPFSCELNSSRQR